MTACAAGGEASATMAEDEPGAVVDANAIVSYNLRAIRQRRGWSQQAVADRLGRLSGRDFTQVSISALERGSAGGHRRRFDAQLLYLLSEVFGVAIAYFFLPPPEEGDVVGRVLAGSGRPIHDLYLAFVGYPEQLAALDDRLAEVDIGRELSEEVLEDLFDLGAAPGWLEPYRLWRQERVEQLIGQWGQSLTEKLAVLARFSVQVRALRAEALGPEVDDNGDCPPGAASAAGEGGRP